jgi:hypothetical protein
LEPETKPSWLTGLTISTATGCGETEQSGSLKPHQLIQHATTSRSLTTTTSYPSRVKTKHTCTSFHCAPTKRSSILTLHCVLLATLTTSRLASKILTAIPVVNCEISQGPTTSTWQLIAACALSARSIPDGCLSSQSWPSWWWVSSS